MSEVRAPSCPTCGEPWAVQRVTEYFYLQADGRENECKQAILCGAGHEFVLARWDPAHVPMVVRPEVVGGGITIRATEHRCVGCGGEVQPGQAYTFVGGVHHIGC